MSAVAPMSGLFVQRVLSLVDAVESWTVLGGEGTPVAPIERYLAYLTQIERSPNTVTAYAHDLKDWFVFLGTRDLEMHPPAPFGLRGSAAGPAVSILGLMTNLSPIEVELLNRLTVAHAEAEMVGWDFSRLDGRWTVDEPWWDFESDCIEAVRATHKGILDLGTGGGERLSSLLDSFLESPVPLPQIWATEGWARNASIAQDRLAAWSIPVIGYEADADEALPFAERCLGLVMARHESYDAEFLRLGADFSLNKSTATTLPRSTSGSETISYTRMPQQTFTSNACEMPGCGSTS